MIYGILHVILDGKHGWEKDVLIYAELIQAPDHDCVPLACVPV